MEDIVLPLLPLIGLIGGFISGLLGLGGGVTFLPLLTFLGHVPLKLATGTTLVQIIMTSTTGIFSHYQKGMVDLRVGLVVGISGIAGGFTGSFLSAFLSNRVLQLIFLMIVGLSIPLLLIPLNSRDGNYEKGNFNKALGIIMGFGGGVLAGLLGVGGGFIIIPMMTFFMKIPLRVAIGTSLMIILILSLGTLAAKLKVGHVDLSITLLVISGSIVGVFLGAYASHRTHVKFLRLTLLSILILIFVMVAYETFF